MLSAAATGQDASSRDERIARQRERLEARLKQARAVPWSTAYETALARLHEEWTANGAEAKFIETADGWIPAFSTQLIQLLNLDLEIAKIDRSKPFLETAIDAVADFNQQCSAAGIELLLVPVPVRLHVYPELVCAEAAEYGRCHAPGLTRFEIALLDAGVEVCDVVDAFSEARQESALTAASADQLFLRANRHWAPPGVVACAEALSTRIRSTEWYKAPEARESRVVREVSNEFDIRQTLLEAPPMLSFDRILGVDDEPVVTSDDASPIVLLGDSYVKNYRVNGADIGRQLHHRLGYSPDTISIRGGSIALSRQALARRPDPAAGKTAVVWLFSVGMLMQQTKQWRRMQVFR